jgi:hypothetical protein
MVGALSFLALAFLRRSEVALDHRFVATKGFRTGGNVRSQRGVSGAREQPSTGDDNELTKLPMLVSTAAPSRL